MSAARTHEEDRTEKAGTTRAVTDAALPTIGIEEELLLVDPQTLQVVPLAPQALEHHRRRWHGDSSAPMAQAELYEQQMELATEPCQRLSDLRRSLVRARTAILDAASDAGALAVAVPTPVLAQSSERLTPDPRYQQIRREYGEMAAQASVCAMHVHVEVADDEEAVAVVNGVRPWLPVLLGLSANSPYWRGSDTGFASWRSQIWSRWPTGGPREPLSGLEEYRETAALMKAWGAAVDDAMLYYDVRLAENLPTVELRVADVCTEVDDALLVAALVRALVASVARERRRGTGEAPEPPWRADLLRAAQWRASRYGVADALVHPVRRELAPAREVVQALVDRTAEVLEDAGDREEVLELADAALARGGGAARQREVFVSSGSLEAVVADLAARTAVR